MMRGRSLRLLMLALMQDERRKIKNLMLMMIIAVFEINISVLCESFRVYRN